MRVIHDTDAELAAQSQDELEQTAHRAVIRVYLWLAGRVLLGLTVLYLLVRFVKWAWTD